MTDGTHESETDADAGGRHERVVISELAKLDPVFVATNRLGKAGGAGCLSDIAAALDGVESAVIEARKVMGLD